MCVLYTLFSLWWSVDFLSSVTGGSWRPCCELGVSTTRGNLGDCYTFQRSSSPIFMYTTFSIQIACRWYVQKRTAILFSERASNCTNVLLLWWALQTFFVHRNLGFVQIAADFFLIMCSVHPGDDTLMNSVWFWWAVTHCLDSGARLSRHWKVRSKRALKPKGSADDTTFSLYFALWFSSRCLRCVSSRFERRVSWSADFIASRLERSWRPCCELGVSTTRGHLGIGILCRRAPHQSSCMPLSQYKSQVACWKERLRGIAFGRTVSHFFERTSDCTNVLYFGELSKYFCTP